MPAVTAASVIGASASLVVATMTRSTSGLAHDGRASRSPPRTRARCARAVGRAGVGVGDGDEAALLAERRCALAADEPAADDADADHAGAPAARGSALRRISLMGFTGVSALGHL